ncbi:MAG: Rieske 2Fe-2S domain-containing protein [Porticoccus sp.]|nr:Rieske 2Fe-2S domain-containing protein [Porticoccus sp.]|tara:strand:+ start:164 stop:481 length:318 start_codon:yes stop_codon:yes gene_type:complete
MNFHPLDKTCNLHEGYSKRFLVNGQDLLLVKSGGLVRLIDNRCPHDGFPLKKAKLVNGCIECPKHRICFRLENGEPLGGDIVSGVPALVHYDWVEEGDQIGIFIG